MVGIHAPGHDERLMARIIRRADQRGLSGPSFRLESRQGAIAALSWLRRVVYKRERSSAWT